MKSNLQNQDKKTFQIKELKKDYKSNFIKKIECRTVSTSKPQSTLEPKPSLKLETNTLQKGNLNLNEIFPSNKLESYSQNKSIAKSGSYLITKKGSFKNEESSEIIKDQKQYFQEETQNQNPNLQKLLEKFGLEKYLKKEYDESNSNIVRSLEKSNFNSKSFLKNIPINFKSNFGSSMKLETDTFSKTMDDKKLEPFLEELNLLFKEYDLLVKESQENEKIRILYENCKNENKFLKKMIDESKADFENDKLQQEKKFKENINLMKSQHSEEKEKLKVEIKKLSKHLETDQTHNYELSLHLLRKEISNLKSENCKLAEDNLMLNKEIGLISQINSVKPEKNHLKIFGNKDKEYLNENLKFSNNDSACNFIERKTSKMSIENKSTEPQKKAEYINECRISKKESYNELEIGKLFKKSIDSIKGTSFTTKNKNPPLSPFVYSRIKNLTKENLKSSQKSENKEIPDFEMSPNNSAMFQLATINDNQEEGKLLEKYLKTNDSKCNSIDQSLNKIKNHIKEEINFDKNNEIYQKMSKEIEKLQHENNLLVLKAHEAENKINIKLTNDNEIKKQNDNFVQEQQNIINELNDKILLLKNQIDLIQKEKLKDIDQHSIEKNELSKKLAEINDQFNVKQEQYCEIYNEKEQLSKLVKEYEIKIKDLQSELKSFIESNCNEEKIREIIEILKNIFKIEEIDFNLKSWNDFIQLIKAKLNDIKNKFQADINQYNEKIKIYVNESEIKEKNLKELIKKYEIMEKEYKLQNDVLKNQNNLLIVEKNHLNIKIEKCETNLNSEIKQLKNSNKLLSDEKNSLIQEIKKNELEMNNHHVLLTENNKKLNEDNNVLSLQIEKLAENNKNLQEEISTIKNQLIQLQSKLSETESRKDFLEKNIQQNQLIHQQSNEKYFQIISGNNEIINDLKIKIGKMENVHKADSLLLTSENQNLLKVNANLANSLKELNDSHKNLSNNFEELSVKLDNVLKEKALFETQIKEINLKIANLAVKILKNVDPKNLNSFETLQNIELFTLKIYDLFKSFEINTYSLDLEIQIEETLVLENIVDNVTNMINEVINKLDENLKKISDIESLQSSIIENINKTQLSNSEFEVKIRNIQLEKEEIYSKNEKIINEKKQEINILNIEIQNLKNEINGLLNDQGNSNLISNQLIEKENRLNLMTTENFDLQAKLDSYLKIIRNNEETIKLNAFREIYSFHFVYESQNDKIDINNVIKEYQLKLEMKDEIYNSKIKNLNEILENAKNEDNNKTHLINDLQLKNSTLNNLFEEKIKLQQELLINNNKFKQEIENFELENQKQKELINELNTELENKTLLIEEKNESIKNTIAEKNLISEKQSIIHDLENKIQACKIHIVTLSSEKSELEKINNEIVIRNKLYTCEIEEMNKNLTSLNDENQKKNLEIEDMKRTFNENINELNRVLKLNENLFHDNLEIKNKYGIIENELCQSRLQNEEIRKMIQSNNVNLEISENFKEKLKNQEEIISALTIELNTFKDENMSLIKQNQIQLGEFNELRNDFENLKVQNLELVNKVNDLQNAINEAPRLYNDVSSVQSNEINFLDEDKFSLKDHISKKSRTSTKSFNVDENENKILIDKLCTFSRNILIEYLVCLENLENSMKISDINEILSNKLSTYLHSAFTCKQDERSIILNHLEEIILTLNIEFMKRHQNHLENSEENLILIDCNDFDSELQNKVAMTLYKNNFLTSEMKLIKNILNKNSVSENLMFNNPEKSILNRIIAEHILPLKNKYVQIKYFNEREIKKEFKLKIKEIKQSNIDKFGSIINSLKSRLKSGCLQIADKVIYNFTNSFIEYEYSDNELFITNSLNNNQKIDSLSLLIRNEFKNLTRLSISESFGSFELNLEKMVKSLVNYCENIKSFRIIKCNFSKAQFDSICSIFQVTQIEFLALSSNKLNDEMISILMNKLEKNYSLKHLDLSHNLLTSLGLSYITKYLRVNQKLEKLIISGNSINGKGLSQLSETLKKSNNTLHYLNISENAFGVDDTQYICSILKESKEIRFLDISSFPFKNESMLSFSKALTQSNSLKVLILDNTELKGGLFTSFFKYFNMNKLTELQINGNTLGSSEIKFLTDVLLSNKNLKSISLKNCGLTSDLMIALFKSCEKIDTLDVRDNHITLDNNQVNKLISSIPNNSNVKIIISKPKFKDQSEERFIKFEKFLVF